MKPYSIRKSNFMILLVAVPLLAVIMVALSSCSGTRKAAKTKTETPPPPPPPPPAGKEFFIVVEEMPEYPGGDAAIMKLIADSLRYPPEAKAKGIQGRVIVRFCVTDIGNSENIQVIRGVEKSLDDEAVRVVKMLKGWTPGKQGGKPVNVWYSVPVTFALKGPDS